MTTLGRASSAVPWSLAAKATRFFFSLATTMVVVRLLSPHDYGILAIVRTAIVFLAALAGAGMGNVLLRYLPERQTLGAGSKSLLRFCSKVQLAGWSLFVVAVVLLRDSIDSLYGSPIGTPLLAGAALVSGNMIFSLLQSTLTATFRTRPLAALQAGSSIAILILSWVALRAGWGVVGVLAASSVPYLLVSLAIAPNLFRSLKGGSPPREGGRLMRYGLPLAAVEVLNVITWRQSETLLLGHFCSPEEAGVFDIAYRLPQLLVEFVPETIWPLVLAAFAEVYTRRREKLGELIQNYFRILFFLVTPVTLFGALYGDLLIEALYGAERAVSGPYSQIFFVIFHLSFFGTPFSMAIFLLEKTWVNLVLAAIFAAVNISLDLILIPRYGLAGAVPPVAIAVALSPVLRAIALRRLGGPVEVPWAFLGKCHLASSSLLLLLPLRRLAQPEISLLLIAAASGPLLLVAVRLVRLLGPEERALIRRSNLPGKDLWMRWLG